MKKIISLAVSVLFVNLILAQATIEGRLEGAHKKRLFLVVGDAKQPSGLVIDSAQADTEGYFTFKVNAQTLTRVSLLALEPQAKTPTRDVSDINVSTYFWVDKDATIKVTGAADSVFMAKIASKLAINDDLMRLRAMDYEAYVRYLFHNKKFVEADKAKNEEEKRTQARELSAQMSVIFSNGNDFMMKHPDAELSAYLLYVNAPRYREEQFKDRYNALSKRVKESRYGILLRARLDLAKQTEEGQVAQNFTVVDKNGQKRSLADYKGKTVILDFWGSWCKPCRMSHPHLRHLQETYGQKGLTILMFACNDKKDQWAAAIEEDGLQAMTHFWNEDKSGEGNIRELYNVTAYPTKIVIDANGKIAMRLRGYSTELQKKLDDLLSDLVK